MLYAYFDESGHESPEWVVVAGFVGNQEQWGAFVPQWKAALGQRPSLHMHDLRWNQERTQRTLARLGPIPMACGLDWVGAVVRVSDYADLLVTEEHEQIYTGYVACLNTVVSALLKSITADEERIELVFEEQREYAPAVATVMSGFADTVLSRPIKPHWFNSEGRPKIAKWSFVPKGSTLMTDPADYLAFALREVFANPEGKKSKWCESIRAGGPGYGKRITQEEIRSIVTRSQAMTKKWRETGSPF